jgi:hypothetical protein
MHQLLKCINCSNASIAQKHQLRIIINCALKSRKIHPQSILQGSKFLPLWVFLYRKFLHMVIEIIINCSYIRPMCTPSLFFCLHFKLANKKNFFLHTPFRTTPHVCKHGLRFQLEPILRSLQLLTSLVLNR